MQFLNVVLPLCTTTAGKNKMRFSASVMLDRQERPVILLVLVFKTKVRMQARQEMMKELK